MRILLVGDASNYHNCLAGALRRQGHYVAVASDGNLWMDTDRDINLRRRPGRAGGALFYLDLLTRLGRRMRGFDAVAVAGCGFLELRPSRIYSIFKQLKHYNGMIVLNHLGADSNYVEMSVDPASPLRYSEWRVGTTPSAYALEYPLRLATWRGEELRDHCRRIYDSVDGVTTALYEYDLAARRMLPDSRVAYIGIPVDTDAYPFRQPDFDGRINILQGCHRGREAEKGALIMRRQIERLAAERPGSISFEYVQNLPFAEFSRKLQQAHIVVDQLYSYTPATTALMAMSMGKITVSGGEEDYYRFIGETELRPIINPLPDDPDSLYRDLSALTADPERMRTLSAQGRRLVERHNSSTLVAERFLQALERFSG